MQIELFVLPDELLWILNSLSVSIGCKFAVRNVGSDLIEVVDRIDTFVGLAPEADVGFSEGIDKFNGISNKSVRREDRKDVVSVYMGAMVDDSSGCLRKTIFFADESDIVKKIGRKLRGILKESYRQGVYVVNNTIPGSERVVKGIYWSDAAASLKQWKEFAGSPNISYAPLR